MPSWAHLVAAFHPTVPNAPVELPIVHGFTLHPRQGARQPTRRLWTAVALDGDVLDTNAFGLTADAEGEYARRQTQSGAVRRG
jgi:hypothetical protein